VAYLLQYNGYTFPVGLRPDAGGSAPLDLSEEDIPRRQGSAVQSLRKKSRTLKVIGTIGPTVGGGTVDSQQALVDAIRAACTLSPGEHPLYFGRTDRYYMAQISDWQESAGQGMNTGVATDLALTFLASDPDAWAATGNVASQTIGTSGTTTLNPATVTPGSLSTVYPVFTLSVTGGTNTGTQTIVVTIANAATGETVTVTLTGTIPTATQTIVLDSRLTSYGATLNAAENYGLFTGRIPKLYCSANAFTVTATSSTSLVLSSLLAVWTPRYP
jgi:hypothetical protein